jgi:hypothetical protein
MSKIAKVVTIMALVIVSLWATVPFVLYFTELRAEHYRQAFLGLFALLLAFSVFVLYNKKRKIEALLACHALLCASLILSSASWVGIPFMDLSYYLSANIFGKVFILFSSLLIIVLVKNSIVYFSDKHNSNAEKRS